MTSPKVLFEADLDASVLRGKQLGIVGYGSQGSAQALNLRDSGYAPLVAVRHGKSFDRARSDGFAPLSVEEVSAKSGVLVLLTPDEVQPQIWHDAIRPHLGPGSLVGFATGFNVHFGLIEAPPGIGFFLVAPKGPGAILRKRFEEGRGIPALVATLEGNQEALAVAEAYAKAIGCARAGVIETTFREEAIADLFGEQCVLSGGLIELMRAAFDALVSRGYKPEVAYIECILEVEYMASLIARVGLASLKDRISSTAFYGGATRGPRVIDENVRRRLGAILDEIETGKFTDEFLRYVKSGRQDLSPWDDKSLESARSKLKVI